MADPITPTGFNWSNVEDISYVSWQMQNDWPPLLLALILIGVLVFSVGSYVWEGPTKRRPLLITLRVLTFVVLLLVLLQPALLIQYQSKGESVVAAMIDDSESMSIRGESLDADVRSAADTVVGGNSTQSSRFDLAKAALLHEGTGVLASLSDAHVTEAFAFSTGTEALDDPATQLDGRTPTAPSTAMGSSLDDLTRRMGGTNVSAVVLLSDMAWNAGRDPVAMARRLGERGVPVFPIPIGQSDPPDVRIASLHVRDYAFPGEVVPLKVQLHSSEHLAGQNVDLVVHLGPGEVSRQAVTLEEGTQIVEVPIRETNRAGRVELAVTVEGATGDITAQNNRMTRTITFIDEKVKVLYVEGSPRWEYRYLRWVLLRDPRLDVRFLLTEADPDLASQSPLYLSGFPAEGQASFDFDLVILGDVPSSQFRTEQMQWMTEQVRRRGGSLLMVGGSRFAPQSYAGTPIEDLLPVRISGNAWQPVPDRLLPVATAAGLEGRIAQLGSSPEHTRALWAQLAPLYELPPVEAKPGATVLVTVGRASVGEEPYPLVSWQRFGAGKTMFVGTELLWRLRKERGREYHERFWAPAIQFLTLSRLLGGNERISIETDAQRYAVGEPVRVYADVLDDYLEPVDQPTYALTLQREGDPGSAQSVVLSGAQSTAGFFQGFCLPREPGVYDLRAEGPDQEAANVARFEVVNESLEMIDPAMRQDVADQVAELSGGQVVQLNELDRLAEWIDQRRPRFDRELAIRLWDHPLMYVLLMVVAGLEWWLRRRQRLV